MNRLTSVHASVRTPLVVDEDQPSTESLQVLSDGSLQLSDVTSRDISSFTCLVGLPLHNDDRLAVAETFTIVLQGSSIFCQLFITAAVMHTHKLHALGDPEGQDAKSSP